VGGWVVGGGGGFPHLFSGHLFAHAACALRPAATNLFQCAPIPCRLLFDMLPSALPMHLPADCPSIQAPTHAEAAAAGVLLTGACGMPMQPWAAWADHPMQSSRVCEYHNCCVLA
jgi:hypothetical protein